MRGLWAVLWRELSGYFATPLGYVFICVFLVLSGVFTLQVSSFMEAGQADLRSFFQWHPILYLFLIPAVSMRMWSEERRSGTIELLMTLPVPVWAAVLGKFLAAWIFATLALALTSPLWVTVSVLGDPDHATILAGYIGSVLLSGAYIAVGSAISALTKSQTIAFVVSAVALLLLTLAGYPPLQDWTSMLPGELGRRVGQTIASFSTFARFSDIAEGVLAARDLVYFLTLTALALALNFIIVDLKKAA